MTNTTKKTRKRKPQGPFSDELIDQLLSQGQGHNAWPGSRLVGFSNRRWNSHRVN